MKYSMKLVFKSMVLLLTISLVSCRPELRGEVQKSTDGKTYLVFELGCDSLIVNGENWPHNIDEKGEVSAGTCKIQCGNSDSGLSINIEEGTTFYFDYWGP